MGGEDRNASLKELGGSPFCHIVGAKVYTYVNFLNLPKWGDKDKVKDILNNQVDREIIWMIENKNEHGESPF